MNIAFRCDASLQIGTGHVMRCLTVADALRGHGVDCHFICRPHKGNLIDLIRQRGHRSTALLDIDKSTTHQINESLPAHASWLGVECSVDAIDTLNVIGTQPIDWLIVDHYAIDECWEKRLRASCKKLMVIDDLADRRHDCDLLLDQNLGHEELDYEDLTPTDSVKLCGPEYALLRPEFAELRPYSLARRKSPKLKRLLITMGGVDKDNITGQVLEALNRIELPTDVELTVIMGLHAPWIEQVCQQAASMPVSCRVLVNVDNMAQLMANSDLAIGAAGGTAWERCCLGLPAVVFVLATNQRSGAMILQQEGAIEALESISDLPLVMQRLFHGPENNAALRKMSQAARERTEGLGVIQVIQHLLNKNG